MKVLWVFAHPEAQSLSGSLHRAGVEYLERAGHDVELSDLYAMKWNPVVTREDFPEEDDERFQVAFMSKRAQESGRTAADIRAEQEKLLAADLVVFQFPLWWYGMPAILKGWFDRVFTMGFGYGVDHPDLPGRTLRYGEGRLEGIRSLVVLTSGSSEQTFTPRGINGPLEHVLFPLLHGTLWYAGLSVLHPLAFCEADLYDDVAFLEATGRLEERLAGASTEEPIPYRFQNHGDYDDDLVLRDDLAPDRTGFDAQIHPVRRPA